MKKILAILLAMSMLLALAVPTMAADSETFTNIVFENLDGDTMSGSEAYLDPWGFFAEGDTWGPQNCFEDITLDEIKAYAQQGGVTFGMMFSGENVGSPTARFNAWDATEVNFNLIPLGNNKYSATVALDALVAAYADFKGISVDAVNYNDIVNFTIQVDSGKFTLYTAWFTNDPTVGISQTSFDVTWKSTFVENEWNSVPTIVEGTLQGGGVAGGRSELVDLWPAILSAVNNDVSVIKSVGVSAEISNNYEWDRQNEGSEGKAGPGAEVFVNADWGSVATDWYLIDGANFVFAQNDTFTVNEVSYNYFSDVNKLQVSVFGGDPYVDDDNIATVTFTVSVVTGSVPDKKADAYIGNKKYVKLSDAVAAAKSGDTIKLVADCEADLVLLYPGVTLDLNGYKLTANNVVSFNTAHIVDNSEAKTGLLAVAKDNLAIGSSNNAQMPIWTGTGYVFATMKMQQTDSYDAETDALTLTFRPSFGTAFNSAFASGMADKGAGVVVRVSWDDGNTTISKDFRYKEDFIKTVYATGGAFTFTATGLSDYSGVSVTVMVISDLKVECAGTAIISE